MSVCKLCKNTSLKNPDKSFFRFPKKHEICKRWAEICSLNKEFEKFGSSNFYKLYRICSDHFESNLIRHDGRKNHLLFNAEPKPFLLSDNVQKNTNSLSNESGVVICRLCGNTNQHLIDIFGYTGRCLDIPTKLKLMPISITKDDSLTKKICVLCIKRLMDCYKFVMNCLSVDEQLRDPMMTDNNITLCLKNLKKYSSFDEEMDKSVRTLMVALPSTHQNHNKNEEIRNQTECYDSTANKMSENVAVFSYSLRNKSNKVQLLDFKHVDFTGHPSLQHDYSLMWLKMAKYNGCRWSPGNTYSCKFCHKWFSTEESCNIHAEAHFLEPDLYGIFLCEVCGDTFKNRFKMNVHLQTHNGSKPYKCTICSFSFHKLSLLKQHKRKHEPPMFNCDKCRTSFSRKSGLKNHLNKNICKIYFQDEVYSTSNSLSRTSSQIKYRLPGKKDKVCDTSSDSKPTFICSSCDMEFNVYNELKSHEETHHNNPTAAIRFLCSFCGKRFLRSDTFKNHVRTHTGERPFACSTCGFRFKQRGDCKKHEKNNHSTA